MITLAYILAWVGVVVTGMLGLVFLKNTDEGMRQATHQFDQLPNVMTGRYIALFLLALGATLYGDLRVLSYLFTVYAFLGFVDAFIYFRNGTSYAKHIGAGVLSSCVALVACLASNSGATL